MVQVLAVLHKFIGNTQYLGHIITFYQILFFKYKILFFFQNLKMIFLVMILSWFVTNQHKILN